MVASGILLSRLVGLVRNRVFAHYFGTSDAADAFNAAFRIPNFLQNLFGEGVLSASFIPVYAGLRARGDEAEARRVAGAVAALLGLVTAALVLARRGAHALAHRDHRAGLHRREARGDDPAGPHPVSGRRAPGPLGLVSRGPQQPPAVLPELRGAGALEPRDHREPDRVRRPALGVRPGRDRRVGLGAGQPAAVRRPDAHGDAAARRAPGRGWCAGRPRCARSSATSGRCSSAAGVVQISAYVDTVLASLLPTGAVAGLSYAQVLYTLPVSLFGMSVSAAELPTMAGATGHRRRAGRLPARSGSARASGRSRSSSFPPRWPSSRWATS